MLKSTTTQGFICLFATLKRKKMQIKHFFMTKSVKLAQANMRKTQLFETRGQIN